MGSKSDKDQKDDKKCKNPKHPSRITTDTKMNMTLEKIKNK